MENEHNIMNITIINDNPLYAVILPLLLCIYSPNTLAGKEHTRIKPPQEHIQDEFEFTIEYDVYKQQNYISPSFDYTRNNWNIQLISQNIALNTTTLNNFQADTYLNLSKFIKLSDHFATIIGTNNGYSLINNPTKTLHNFDYIDLRFRPIKYFIVHIGPYYTNKALSTTTNIIGYQSGIELNTNDYQLNVDYINGQSNVSGINIINEFKRTNTYIGIGIPTPNSHNNFYGMVGFNYPINF